MPLRVYLSLFCLLYGFALKGQLNDSTFVVNSIKTIGLVKTKEVIVMRELTFKVGDTIRNWSYHKEQSRKQLINLFLFNEVKIDRVNGDVLIHATERWYTWPIPVLDYADRNFNQWWLTKDPKRLIYGLDLSQYNIGGRNQTLVLNLVMGYTRSAGLTYKVPYINKKMSWGMQVTAKVNANKEVWSSTINDKVNFFRDNDRTLIRRQMGEVVFTHRKKFFTYHHAYAGFRRVSVDPIIADSVNYNYLMYHQDVQNEGYLGYQFVFDQRDFKGYPLKGHLLKLQIEGSNYFFKQVPDFQTLILKLAYSRYFKIKGHLFGSAHLTARYFDNMYPQYTATQALGYGKDYIRGYELRVIDGSNFALGKLELKYRILNANYAFAEGVKNYEKLPVSMYLTGFMDAGFVRNWRQIQQPFGNNILPNTLQNGGGIGLNMVMYYDYCMRIEYSADRQLNRRFYLSFVASM